MYLESRIFSKPSWSLEGAGENVLGFFQFLQCLQINLTALQIYTVDILDMFVWQVGSWFF